MTADEHYIHVDVVVPHEIVAKVECCGCLVAMRSGDNAEIRCNECDALIDTVSLIDLQATMTKLAMPMWGEVMSERCPHCGALNVFPGFSRMDAYICKGCREGVKVERAIH
jgi:phage FluMu protein Com